MVLNESKISESVRIQLVSAYDKKSKSRTSFLIDSHIGRGLVLEAYTTFDNIVDTPNRVVFGYNEDCVCQEILLRNNFCQSVFFKKQRKLSDSHTAIETWKFDSSDGKSYLFESAILEIVTVYEPEIAQVVRLKLLYSFSADLRVSSVKRFYYAKSDPRTLKLIKEFDIRFPFVVLNFIRWNAYRLMDKLLNFRSKSLYLPLSLKKCRKKEVDDLPNKTRFRSVAPVKWLPEESFIFHETVEKFPFFARMIDRYSYSSDQL